MKMGNIAYKAGTEPTSLAFQANVLTVPPPRLPDVTTLSTPTCLGSSLLERSVHSTTYVPLGIVNLLMLTITYKHTYM